MSVNPSMLIKLARMGGMDYIPPGGTSTHYINQGAAECMSIAAFQIMIGPGSVPYAFVCASADTISVTQGAAAGLNCKLITYQSDATPKVREVSPARSVQLDTAQYLALSAVYLGHNANEHVFIVCGIKGAVQSRSPVCIAAKVEWNADSTMFENLVKVGELKALGAASPHWALLSMDFFSSIAAPTRVRGDFAVCATATGLRLSQSLSLRLRPSLRLRISLSLSMSPNLSLSLRQRSLSLSPTLTLQDQARVTSSVL